MFLHSSINIQQNISDSIFFLSSDVGIEDLEYGWCFLENVEHPENPTESCYEDVAWSAADGRFGGF